MDFIKEYFAPSVVGSFALVGVLLIDKDNDGVPDKWEQEIKKDGDANDSGRKHDAM